MALAIKDIGGRFRRLTDQSGANAQLQVNTNALGAPHRLIGAYTKYSGAPTQAGVTTTLDSGAGAAWDTTLNTGAANAQNTVYEPAARSVAAEDDGYLVTAPAGGGALTSQITVIVELLN